MKGGKKKSGATSSSEALPTPIENDGGGQASDMPRDGDEGAAAAEDQAEQHHQGDGEGDGDEGEEEEEGEGEGYDQFEDLQIEDGNDEEAERPKLAEGFYEIEAVRRKRVRKGEVQYLIKWRGWPETANTWEPIDNLLSCTDVIDAFEESLRSGKHRSTRRRKRKYGGPHYQPKKQQQHSPAAATYNIPTVQVKIMDEPLPSIPVNVSVIANEGENNVGGVSNAKIAKQANESDPNMVSQQIEEMNDRNELDLKLSELKGTMPTNEGNGDKFAIHFQSACASEENVAANGLLKVDNVEQGQAGRCTGAKRRKSGSVKRFKQDAASCVPNDAQNALSRSTDVSCGRVTRQRIQIPNSMANDLGLKNTYDNSINMSTITEIIKPISYSASVSNNVQDVLVTFMAKRSDGKEVVVDNKFLKTNNPLLLINFYEQHLRYSPT
ncbi:chromo domain protein LHP1-like [Cornus florida]|uniref:chromo domain protein LHP1-like n=1 Tax=Cornus florida TaxID=4283 RepID=UPI00289FB021|nr:chromo domain protein LHP1-like [Cornus florida]